MRADAEMDALNRNLLRRLEEAATPPVEEQFREMYTRTMMGGETIAERIAATMISPSAKRPQPGSVGSPWRCHLTATYLETKLSSFLPQIAADYAVRNERRPARDLNDLARMGLLDKRDKRIGRESKSSGVSTAGRYSGVLGRLITMTYFARSSSCSTRRPAIPFAVC